MCRRCPHLVFSSSPTRSIRGGSSGPEARLVLVVLNLIVATPSTLGSTPSASTVFVVGDRSAGILLLTPHPSIPRLRPIAPLLGGQRRLIGGKRRGGVEERVFPTPIRGRSVFIAP